MNENRKYISRSTYWGSHTIIIAYTHIQLAWSLCVGVSRTCFYIIYQNDSFVGTSTSTKKFAQKYQRNIGFFAFFVIFCSSQVVSKPKYQYLGSRRFVRYPSRHISWQLMSYGIYHKMVTFWHSYPCPDLFVCSESN